VGDQRIDHTRSTFDALLAEMARFDEQKGIEGTPIERIGLAYIGEVGEMFSSLTRVLRLKDKVDSGESVDLAKAGEALTHFEEEWADSLVFLLDLFARYRKLFPNRQIDAAKVFRRVMDRNWTRRF
jgi:hypothetical protein